MGTRSVRATGRQKAKTEKDYERRIYSGVTWKRESLKKRSLDETQVSWLGYHVVVKNCGQRYEGPKLTASMDHNLGVEKSTTNTV